MNKSAGLENDPVACAVLNRNHAQCAFVQELIDHFEELDPQADYADRENEV